MVAASLLTYGMVADNGALAILGFTIAVPVFFGADGASALKGLVTLVKRLAPVRV